MVQRERDRRASKSLQSATRGGKHDFSVSTRSTGSTGSTRGGFSYVEQWTPDDERDVRWFVCGAGEAGPPPSNMAVQLAALQAGLKRAEVPCCDPDGEMVERLDSAARAARVRRVLEQLERSCVEILEVAFGYPEVIPGVRARYGDELAGLVVFLARGADPSAALAAAAAERLGAAKQAYARQRGQAAR